MKIKNQYNTNKVIAIKLQQEDVNGMLLNYDLTGGGNIHIWMMILLKPL